MHQFYPDLQGYIWDPELEALMRYAKGRYVVEVGTWKGRSAIPMATVAKQVHCVDTWLGDAFAGFGNFWPEFDENRKRYHLNNIFPHIGRMEEVLPCFAQGMFSMGFYDADHTGDATYTGLTLLGRLLSMSGDILAVHDYNTSQPQYVEAVEAVDRYVWEMDWERVELVHNLLILRRRVYGAPFNMDLVP